MATLFDFFLRREKPQPPPPPTRGEAVGERLAAEIDEALAPLNVPGELGEMLKKDLREALDIKGAYRPGYEPGAAASVKFNLIDAVTNPLKTGGRMVDSFREELKRPPVPLLWTDAEDAVWRYFFGTVWVDAQGYGVLPRSLESAVLRWNEKARLRITRLAAERGIQKSPGLTLMMAEQLFKAGTTHVGGVGLTTIRADARVAERAVTRRLIDADLALRGGDRAGAEKLWAEATDIQAGELKFNPQSGDLDPNGVDWTETAAFKSRGKVRKEFERQIRMGSQKNAPQKAHDLANSPEAKFWRYWQNRNLYYFGTLNFLTTYRDKGFWGTAKIYAWNKAVSKIFGAEPGKDASPLTRLRYYSYPANALGWVQEKTVGRVLRPILNKITDAKALFARTWKRFIKDPLTGIIERIRDKVVRRIAGWVAMKLGITGLGAALGSVVPGAGTAIGAIIMAVASFLVETAIQKMGGVWRVAAFGVVGGLSLVFAALMIVASFLIILVGLIFNTNAVLPSAVTTVPITVTKEACEPALDCDEFHNPLQILKDGLVHSIRWRITIKNTGEANELINWGDDYCQPGGDPSGFPVPIGPGGEITAFCNQNITANEDKMVTNTVRGTTTPATAPFSGTGAVIVGEPETADPIGWPLAYGCITQGPETPSGNSHYLQQAIDINLNNAGNPALATHSGVVVDHCYTVTGCTSGCGNKVRIRSSAGFETLYCHLAAIYVRTGDPVFFGQEIGTVDNTGTNTTGTHLHYQFIGLEMAPPNIPQVVPSCVGRSVCNFCW